LAANAASGAIIAAGERYAVAHRMLVLPKTDATTARGAAPA